MRTKRAIPIEVDARTAARVLGRKGGQSKSPAKQAASRANGTKGGRPRKPPPSGV